MPRHLWQNRHEVHLSLTILFLAYSIVSPYISFWLLTQIKYYRCAFEINNLINSHRKIYYLLNVTLVLLSMFACFQRAFFAMLLNRFLLMFLCLHFSIHYFQTINGINIAIYPLQRISDTHSISSRFQTLFFQW